MGQFSSLTADTQECIRVDVSRTVYFLQPHGEPPIVEHFYEGYGKWGGVDQYEWLITMNASALGLDLDDLDSETKRDLGIGLALGHVVYSPERDEYFSILQDYRPLLASKNIKVTHINDFYGAQFEDSGFTINEMIARDELVVVPVASIAIAPYAAKFSYDPDAIYEELPPSLECPHQGRPPYDEDNSLSY